MDINDVRALVTVASFLAFLGVVWWAYSSRRIRAFDRAARSVLEEPDDIGLGGGVKGKRQ